MCSATELLREKIRNLEGMIMGCQQDIATLDTTIKQKEQTLVQDMRKSGKQPCQQDRLIM
jgi:prefoldin subunit 5